MPDIIKFRRVAKELFAGYFTHQSWKAHEGLFMPVPSESTESRAGEGSSRSRSLRRLAGVELSEPEASAAWSRVLEHKWYLGERLGRDVGLRVAAVDYFENIEPPRVPASRRASAGGLPPRLPMMMPFGQGS